MTAKREFHWPQGYIVTCDYHTSSFINGTLPKYLRRTACETPKIRIALGWLSTNILLTDDYYLLKLYMTVTFKEYKETPIDIFDRN